MSMAVDLSKPLTREERAYLNERGQQAVIDRVDALHGVADDTVFEGDGTGPRTQQLMTGMAAVQRPEELVKQLEDLGYKVTIEPVSDDEDDEVEGVAPYTEWPLTELKDEIDRRNEGRADGDKISKAGGVPALAQRLYADDAAATGDPQE